MAGPDASDPSAALLARWQGSGDLAALDELLRIEVTILRERIRARSGNLLSPSVSSSDVAQEAVLNLFKVQEPPSFDQPAALRAYLWTSAWRLLHAHLQRAGRTNRLDPSASQAGATALATSGGLGAVDERDRSVALELARALLEPDDQSILDLVYFEQQTVESAAGRLGISNEAAKKRVARARRRLAEKLGRWSDFIG